MFRISVKYEGNKSMQKVADEFRGQLSEKEIAKTAAFAVNTTARRVLSMVRKEAKKDYTISNKYLQRMAVLSKPARGNASGLYAEVSYNFGTIPMVGFKYKNLNPKKQKYFAFNSKMKGVQVEIKKGKTMILRHAFIKSMASGHLGIWAHGYYKGKRFIPDNATTSSGKLKITELKSASPYTMYTSKSMSKKIQKYVDDSLTERFRAMLKIKLDKISDR
jgi:hypothetical protein